MERKSFTGRFIIPVGVVFVAMTVGFILYNTGGHIPNRFLRGLTVNIGAVSLGLSVAFGPFLVYPMSFFGGAGFRERVVAVFVNPVLWGAKEIVRVSETFSFAESLYYMFNPLMISMVAVFIADIGLLEMLCRRGLKKRGEDVKVFSTPALAAIIGGYSFALFVLLWGLGVHSFYIFIEGYKSIFGTGL